MPNPPGLSIQQILGLGYAGAAHIGPAWVLLMPSSAEEADNLTKSAGTTSTDIAFATGQIPVRQRRALNLTLNCLLTPSSAGLIHTTTFDWRNNQLTLSNGPVTVFLANQEGYYTPEAYVNSVSLSVQENAIATIAFNITAFLWSDYYAFTGVPRSQAAFIPYNNSDYQPIPHWLVQVSNTSQPGVVTDFNYTLNNNWQFGFLAEATPAPPTPRMITPGPLDIDLNLTTIAYGNTRPLDQAVDVQIQIGGGTVAGIGLAKLIINHPFMYRDPSRQITGFGSQNEVLKWQANWKCFRQAPSFLVQT